MCVAGKPLVYGSALRLEGQLTVYNYSGDPTYRCLYPTPPPPDSVTNCSDGEMIGAVVGVLGCHQALGCSTNPSLPIQKKVLHAGKGEGGGLLHQQEGVHTLLPHCCQNPERQLLTQ